MVLRYRFSNVLVTVGFTILAVVAVDVDAGTMRSVVDAEGGDDGDFMDASFNSGAVGGLIWSRSGETSSAGRVVEVLRDHLQPVTMGLNKLIYIP
jgi:hypothetical protein